MKSHLLNMQDNRTRGYGKCSMESDSEARILGYPSATHWLDTVTGEAAFQCLAPGRLLEYDRIFRPRRALTRYEAELLAALEEPVDWDHPDIVDDRLTAAATTAKYRALDLLDRL